MAQEENIKQDIGYMQRFCDEEGININRPWSRDGYTYATNGHLMIRIPGEHAEPNEKAPYIKKFKWNHSEIADWQPLPEYEPKFIKIDRCEECNAPLSEMYFKGILCIPLNILEPVQGQDHGIASRYIDLIKTLPGALISNVRQKGNDPIPFVWDGGEGYLMGMRKKEGK